MESHTAKGNGALWLGIAILAVLVSLLLSIAPASDSDADEAIEYSFYIDLGGEVSGTFLGTDLDYGEGGWVRVSAANAKDALTLACEQRFGEGTIVYQESEWGTSIDTINGMSGNGIGWRSNESSGEWDDVYYYPVQYIYENRAWRVAEVAIPDYTGSATIFAVSVCPLTFDEFEHTFEDEEIQAKYDLLKTLYDWSGYGQSQQPFISVNGIHFGINEASLYPKTNYKVNVSFSPSNATNKNVVWSSSDESVVTVLDSGHIATAGSGTAVITATSVYGSFTDSFTVTILEPKTYQIYLDLGGTITGEILFEDEPTDYGAPEWVTVEAYDARTALIAACDQKFGENSLVISSGIIRSINGLSMSGIAYYSDQSNLGTANWNGIIYYPCQFVKEADGWVYPNYQLTAYTGESTTFAIVCQPFSMDSAPVDFTFTVEGQGYAYDYGKGKTFPVYAGYDLQAIYENYFSGYFGWEYGFPSEPFFADEYSTSVGDRFYSDGLIYEVTSLEPLEASVVGYYDDSLTDLVIPSGATYIGNVYDVTEIGKEAFMGCKTLTSVSLGSVEKVGVKAFARCTGLTSVYGGDSLETVSAYAFYKCIGLNELDLDDSAESIRIFGSYSFYRCWNLEKVYVYDGMTTVASKTFKQSFVDENGEALAVSADSLKGYIYHLDAEQKTYSRSALVPVGTVFSDGTFEYRVISSMPCEAEVIGLVADVTEVSIPRTVENGETFEVVRIGQNAFKGNTSITSVSASVAVVGKQAFYGCSSLETVVLDEAAAIGVKAFAYCRSLVDTDFSDSLETIMAYAFYKCTKIEQLDLFNVKTIGSYAFCKCTALKQIDTGDSLAKICVHAFDGCGKIGVVSFSPVLKVLGTDAFGGIVFYDSDETTVLTEASELRGYDFLGIDGELVKNVVE